ncbi:oligosaccharide flippase family protein [Rhodanobacter sp. MP1X3]|uniref:lipopolysaccharide biosynthesis protein n=1 Tax=Rhodanobacter sp. MP1X3 TaxID=2723086 RepID=UPI00161F5DC1|nr:oligosaccharide flippase family protein [Rhodanobacter sp. MP1X3]MBB6242322.1 O-antigen/teichoic acid export membrane protein [Rhodanobacter sp. MP1X3]
MRLPDRTAFSGPIARATIRTSFVLGLRLLVQTGTLLFVARLLGPQQFGAFAGVAALAVVLGTLSTFGMHFVLLSEVSREPALRREVLRYALPTTLLCGSVLFAVYLLITMLALGRTGMSLPTLIAIGVTETLLQPLFGIPAAEHLALERTARSQLLTTLPLALRLVAAATVFFLHPTDPLSAYSYGYLLASLIALAVATFSMPAPWPAPKCWRLPTGGEIRNSAGYAALAVTANSPTELDKTLAARLLPLASAGIYAAGTRVIGATTLPVIAMMLSVLPRLFREGHVLHQRTTQLVRWVLGATCAYSFTLAALMWFIAPIFVYLFGPKYHGLGHVMHWLCLAIPGIALRLAAGSVLMALGNPWMRAGFEVIGLAVMLVAAILLTARFGATGMPLALACSEWMMTLLGWAFVFACMRRKRTT